MITKSKQRVLVTGASGFIGRHLVPYLNALGIEVVSINRGNWPASREQWRSSLEGVKAIVHLAGTAHDQASPDQYRADCEVTRGLAEISREVGLSQFVFVSSINAQADAGSAEPLTEDTPANPITSYGISKLAAEVCVRESGVAYTIMRPVVVTGSGAKGNLAALSKLVALPIPLPLNGLAARRSCISIESFCSAVHFVLFNQRALNQTFIVSDPGAKTLSEIVLAMNDRAWLFYFPPPFLKLGFAMIGRSSLWERIDCKLVAEPQKLMEIGWSPCGTNQRKSLETQKS